MKLEDCLRSLVEQNESLFDGILLRVEPEVTQPRIPDTR